MECGSSKVKVIVGLIIVALLIMYKYQNLLDISLEVQNKIGTTISDGGVRGIDNNIDDNEEKFELDQSKTLQGNNKGTDKKLSSKTSTPFQQTSLDEVNVDQNLHIPVSSILGTDELLNALVKNDSNVIWVDPTGDFLSRVRAFNDVITKFGHHKRDSRHYKPWQGIDEPLDVLWCNRDDFMEVLRNYTHVTTVLLRWHDAHRKFSWSSLQDESNILVKQYYKWSATEPLCKWIETPGYTNARWDAVYNRSCNTDMALGGQAQSIEPVYFHGKPINVRDYWPNEGLSYPPEFYSDFPDYLIYMHVIEDSIVLETGDVISKNLKLVPYACSQDTDARPPLGYQTSSIYSEVILVSQFWGAEFFHSMIEGIPRLAAYVKFLVDNPSVLIHVVEPKPYIKNTLSFLGINPERLISHVVRAKILYVPQATPCGFAQIHELQLLNHLYTTKLEERHPQASNNSTVVFIRRSGLRKFRQNAQVEETVVRAARDFGLPFVVFRDDPSPGMEEAMAVFYSARLVVAPHGAGLSNVVYSRPGTYVIEAVCNEPHVNMCYQWTSHILGHRYHAIASRRGCEEFIDVEPALVDLVVRTYLQQIKWTN